MSAISLKSITGITSITTPSGVDNVFTVHTNDTTERFRVDQTGNLNIAGIVTVTKDLDVDGHTNLDNVSIAGVSTFSGDITIADKIIHTGDTDTSIRFSGADTITAETGGSERLRITSTGQFVVGTNPTVNSGNIAHIEAPTSFNSGETIVNIEGNNATAAARLLLHNNNTGGSAHNEILGTDAGGQSTSSIRFYNTDQSNNYGEIAFGTRNASGTPPVDRMRISKDGYVTKPNHPAFKCSIATQSSPNTGVVSENNGFTLNATSGRDAFNNGSHFSEATGRFTAPVTGLYFFHFSVMRYSGNGSGSMDLRIKKNTGLIWARSYKASYSTSYESMNVTTITNMTAGHFVEFILGANMSVYDDDSYMLGYLIG